MAQSNECEPPFTPMLSMKNAGAVACGHEQTAIVAGEILAEGGNAFDAAVAAHFAACVAEPVLASLGGGGFLLARPATGQPLLYDFFSQTPLARRSDDDIDFFPIEANFGETTQEFHIGMGSIATPGSVKGMFSVFKERCTLPLRVLLQPAIALAKNGVLVNDFQAYIFDIIKPIYQLDDHTLAIFKTTTPGAMEDRQLVRSGELLKQPALADALDALLNEGERIFYQGEIARAIVNGCRDHGGYLQARDFTNYRVIKRKPLCLKYRSHRIWTNPPPSSGGMLIAFALKLLETLDIRRLSPGSPEYFDLLCHVMHMTNKARIDIKAKSRQPDMHDMLDEGFMAAYRRQIVDRYAFSRGTTHISIIDKQGNMASLTVSNGEGSGFVAPGTGIMLNNMLGEEDLNPNGFHQWEANQRISSMMAPTIIEDERLAVALGSGGSNRLRTAILQVIVNLLDFGMSLDKAIDAPRIHFENGLLNVEAVAEPVKMPHLNATVTELKTWKSLNLFFGGVHGVALNADSMSGKGDPRRGGYAMTI